VSQQPADKPQRCTASTLGGEASRVPLHMPTSGGPGEREDGVLGKLMRPTVVANPASSCQASHRSVLMPAWQSGRTTAWGMRTAAASSFLRRLQPRQRLSSQFLPPWASLATS
jgi:hypothetical protein